VVPCETTVAAHPVVTTHHYIPCSISSPLSGNAAIPKMASGGPIRCLNLEAGMAHAKESHASFKSKVASNNALKLTASNVFTWICDDIIKKLKLYLVLARCKEAKTSATILLYQKQAKALPGKSLWIAERRIHLSIVSVSPELINEKERPTFDLKLASKVAPDCEWNDVVSSFTLDSRKLRQFIVESMRSLSSS
jgi:hypothetical protein